MSYTIRYTGKNTRGKTFTRLLPRNYPDSQYNFLCYQLGDAIWQWLDNNTSWPFFEDLRREVGKLPRISNGRNFGEDLNFAHAGHGEANDPEECGKIAARMLWMSLPQRSWDLIRSRFEERVCD